MLQNKTFKRYFNKHLNCANGCQTLNRNVHTLFVGHRDNSKGVETLFALQTSMAELSSATRDILFKCHTEKNDINDIKHLSRYHS